jgi:putative thiamine transport system ATP-binding protein
MPGAEDRRLILDGVEIWLGRKRLLGPLELAIAPGEIATLMGPSGSGKSSLLAYVCGTLDPAFRAVGRIRLAGTEIGELPPERRHVGILFQDDLLFPHLSVAGNLAFGLPASLERVERRVRVAAALAEAGLEGFETRDPATLSGGQRARVALLRMLLSEPRALLLDEPFGRLDSRLRDRFRRLVFERARAHALPVLLVTHDDDDARAASGTIVTVGKDLAEDVAD